jgi:hypothetical protein
VYLPAQGQPIHTRSLTITVTEPEPGVLLASGDVIDLRKCSFAPVPDRLQAAGIIHHMRIEARVAEATRELLSLVTEQPVVAFETADGAGDSCRDPSPALQRLVGERFDAGFRKKLGATFGGPRGCSHLLTLFYLMASAVPRALDLEAAERARGGPARRPEERIFQRSVFVDGFEQDDSRLQLAVQLSDFHSHAIEHVENALDRLAEQSEVRLAATVQLQTMTVHDVWIGERRRSGQTATEAVWRDRSGRLAELDGHGIMSGLGGTVSRLLGERAEDELLRDAALNLAPGFIQCMAALTDRWISQAQASSGGIPSFMESGGMTNSCYMWREDSRLLQLRTRR